MANLELKLDGGGKVSMIGTGPSCVFRIESNQMDGIDWIDNSYELRAFLADALLRCVVDTRRKKTK